MQVYKIPTIIMGVRASYSDILHWDFLINSWFRQKYIYNVDKIKEISVNQSYIANALNAM